MLFASALRFVLRWSGAALIALVVTHTDAFGAISPAADGFDPNIVDGNVYAMVIQPDGKIVVGGSFTSVQPNGVDSAVTRNRIARFTVDGRLDAAFDPNVDGQVNAIALQSDGKILIAGKFATVGGVARARGARLNANGSLDTTFADPALTGGLTPEASAVAVQSDGKVIFGGGFTSAGGASRNRIARFSTTGVVDPGFDPNANNLVLAIAVQPDGKIVIGGGFTTLGSTTVARKRLARLNTDGTPDSFDPSADNSVNTIELMPDGRILVGGTFTKMTPNGGTEISVVRIARLDKNGGVTSGFVSNADGAVSAIKLQRDGTVMVGGSFSGIGNGVRPYVARLLPDGSLDYNFNAGPNFNVYALGVQSDGGVVIAGGFTTLVGTGRTSVVRNHIARISPSGGLDADFRPDANGRLASMSLQADGKILIGGSFTSIAGATRGGFARLGSDGKLDTSFVTDLDGTVTAFAQQPDGKTIIGGSFTRVGGLARSNLARLKTDGSVDETFDPAPNAQVTSIAVQADGKIVIGGFFTQLRPNSTTEPVARGYIARINADGTLDTAYFPTANNAVASLLLQPDGKLLVGGNFTGFAPNGATTLTTRLGLARLESDGKLDTVFRPTVDGTVLSIALQADNKVVFGGIFARLAPNDASTATARNNVARVNADGSLDATFDPNADSTVFAVTIQADKKIVIGGRFKNVGGTARNFVARLEESGAVDGSFDLKLDALPGNQVVSLAQPSSTSLLIGGAFTSVNGTPRYRLAKITNGALDSSFNSDLSSAGGAPISVIVTGSNGGIVAAGSFSGLNGNGSSNLAAFTADSTPNTGFSPNINGPVYAVAQLPYKGSAQVTQRSGFAWLTKEGNLRSSFTIPTSVAAPTIVDYAFQDDGKIVVGGVLPTGSTTGSLLRLNADGTLDASFNALVDGTVTTVLVQSDKKILIAGEFSTAAGATRTNLARFNADGTIDTSFTAATNARVSRMIQQPDGKFLIGGGFSSVTGSGGTTAVTRNYIARLNTDGTVDTDFNPNLNGAITALALQPDNKIWIGGNFTALAPNGATTTTARTYVARLNAAGTLDETIDLKVNAGVQAIAVQSDGKVLLGGYFTSIAGITRLYLARVDSAGAIDAAFNPNPNTAVFSISLPSDGKILIGGAFTALEPGQTVYNPRTATPRNRAARLNIDGTIDPTFNPNFDNSVGKIAETPDKSIIATGSFSAIQPTGALIVGGAFNAINGLVNTNNLVLFSADGSISSTFQPNPNGTVYGALAQVDGRLVVGGSFTTIAGTGRNRIARFNNDDSLDGSFNPNADGDVFAIARQPDGKLLVGGAFTTIGGAGRSYLARLNADGSNDGSFSASLGGAVRTIALQADGKILVTSSTSASTNNLVRLNTDGSSDSSFNAGNDGMVSSVAVQSDGHVIAGGTFNTIGGAAHPYLARLNSNGTLDATLGAKPSGAVTAVSVQNDGKILLGGTFSSIDGLPRFGIARIAAPATATNTFTSNSTYTAVIWTPSGGMPVVSSVMVETSLDSTTWKLIGEATQASGSPSWTLGGVSLLGSAPVFVRVRAIVPASPGASSGVIYAQNSYSLAAAAPSVPAINSATVVSGADGSSFLYAISALGNPTSFNATGLPAGLSVNTSTGVISGIPTQQGTFTVTLSASNSLGTGTATLTLIVGAPGSVSDTGHIVNLSVLAPVSSANPIIAGFVVSGSGSQPILIRAIGPGLSSLGVPNYVGGPRLTVYKGSTVLSDTTSWGGSTALSSEFTRLGAFPLATTSTDAAVLLTLAPGPYTLHVDDPSGSTGMMSLAEVYDALPSPPPTGSPHLVNIAARGVVSSAGQMVTGGFVIAGSTARKVLVRGIGPGLAGQGVTGAITDATVVLNKINTGVIAQNDNWGTPTTVNASYPAASAAEISAAATATGAFALASGSADAALLVTLAPGVYTAQVSGAGTLTGAVMVEVYEVP